MTYTTQDAQPFTTAAATVSRAAADKPFRAEMIFTPEESQRTEGTLFAAGGNFSVVYVNNKLKYGFSSYSSNRWAKHTQEVDIPAAGEKHVLQVAYNPAVQNKVEVTLDGNKLAPVVTDKLIALHDQTRNKFGFGRDVHPGAANRGFKGSIEAIRVLPNDESVDFAFKLPSHDIPAVGEEPAPSEGDAQPVTPGGNDAAQPAATPETLDVTFDGTIANNAYTAASGETVAGSLALKAGSETITTKALQLAGTTTGLTYTLPAGQALSAGDDALTLNKPVRAEMFFTPAAGEQPELATLFAAGGNMFVRYQGGQIRYGFDSFVKGRSPRAWMGYTQNMPAPEAGKPHLLRVEYLPTAAGTTMKVSIDGTAGPDVVAQGNYSRMSDAVKTQMGFGREVNPGAQNPGRGFRGSLQGIRLVPEGAEFKYAVPAPVADATEEPATPGEDPSDQPAEEPGETPAGNHAAVTKELLSVAFGGTLTNTQYTTQGEEIQVGRLHSVLGQERQNTEGITLTGGRQGMQFEARDYTFGADRINQSFVMEAVFKPQANQAGLGTLLAAGGNLSVRYDGNQLTWGWDHDNSPRSGWSKPRGGVKAPTAGQEHVFSMHYRMLPDGKAVVDAWLDGDQVESVEGAKAANIAGSANKLFGIGNDVHPAAGDRGFKGLVSQVRIAATNGGATTRDIFKLQPTPNTIDLLRTSWEGQSNGAAYTVAAGDTMLGATSLTGTARTADGTLAVAGAADAAVFTPNAQAAEQLNGKGFLVETTFTPRGDQASGATIVNVGGAFFAAYEGNQLTYGYRTADGVEARTAAFNTETEHVLSLAYQPTEGGSTVTAWLDRVALETITSPKVMVAQDGQGGLVAFGNELGETPATKGFVGSFGESRYAVLNGAFRPKDFALQVLDEVCADISALQPGPYIPVSADDCKKNIIKKATLVRPTEKQAVWQEEGLTAFIHYGINTYTPDNSGIGIEWGHGRVSPSKFNPTGDLNPDAWVKALRDNGYRTTILVLKHHDGFMSWPSRYSDYTVKNSPWKNGQGNVLREFTDAAHKYGMKVGLYISPADSHEEERPGGTHGNGSARSPRTIPTLVANDDREGKIPEDKIFTYQATDYGAFFLNTLYEVLTEYGKVDEVWFDGATGNTARPEPYDYAAFYDMISKLQPGANVAVGGRDIRWIGNEHGEGRFNEWSPLAIRDVSNGGAISLYQPKRFDQALGSDDHLVEAVRAGEGVNMLHWWPGEADMKLTGGWFAHHNRSGVNIDHPKSPASLLNHYEETVGRNSVMLLNVPPTMTGQFAPASVDAISGFAAERRKAFTLDHALGLPVTIGDTTTMELTNGNVRDGVLRRADDLRPMEIDLGAPKTVNRIGISEDILDAGQVVRTFKVEAEQNGEWSTIADSGVIGAQRIVKLRRPVTAQKFRITVTSTRADYVISNFQLYGQLDADPGVAVDAYIDCSAPTAGVGTADSPFNSLEQLRKHELAPGSDLYFKGGADCAAANITVWAYGTAENPVELKSWGAGEATIGGQSLNAYFAKYAAQGWAVGSVEDYGEQVEPGAEPGDEPGGEPGDEPGAEPGGEPGDEPAVEPGAGTTAGGASDNEPAAGSDTTGASDTAGGASTGTPGSTDTPGSAGVEPPATPKVTLTVTKAGSDEAISGGLKRGEQITVRAAGLPANSRVEFWIHSEPQRIATAAANEAGEASANWTVANVEDGAHTFYARSADGAELAAAPAEVAGDVTPADGTGTAQPGSGTNADGTEVDNGASSETDSAGDSGAPGANPVETPGDTGGTAGGATDTTGGATGATGGENPVVDNPTVDVPKDDGTTTNPPAEGGTADPAVNTDNGAGQGGNTSTGADNGATSGNAGNTGAGTSDGTGTSGSGTSDTGATGATGSTGSTGTTGSGGSGSGGSGSGSGSVLTPVYNWLSNLVGGSSSTGSADQKPDAASASAAHVKGDAAQAKGDPAQGSKELPSKGGAQKAAKTAAKPALAGTGSSAGTLGALALLLAGAGVLLRRRNR